MRRRRGLPKTGMSNSPAIKTLLHFFNARENQIIGWAEAGDAFSVGFSALLKRHIIQLKCDIDSDKVTSKEFDISVPDMEYSE